jgi:hypothetical protein
VAVKDEVEDAESDEVALGLAPVERDGVAVIVVVELRDWVAVDEGVTPTERLLVAVSDEVDDAESDEVALALAPRDSEGVAVSVLLDVSDRELVALELAPRESDGVAVRVPLDDSESEPEGDALAPSESVGVAVRVEEEENDRDGDADAGATDTAGDDVEEADGDGHEKFVRQTPIWYWPALSGSAVHVDGGRKPGQTVSVDGPVQSGVAKLMEVTVVPAHGPTRKLPVALRRQLPPAHADA